MAHHIDAQKKAIRSWLCGKDPDLELYTPAISLEFCKVEQMAVLSADTLQRGCKMPHTTALRTLHFAMQDTRASTVMESNRICGRDAPDVPMVYRIRIPQLPECTQCISAANRHQNCNCRTLRPIAAASGTRL